MNLDRIERLKGLLARVELNTKKPRRAVAAPSSVITAPSSVVTAPSSVITAPSKVTAPVVPPAPALTVPSSVATAPSRVAAPVVPPAPALTAPVFAPAPVMAPAAAVAKPTIESVPPISLSDDEFEVEDVSLDDFAVEISPEPSLVAPVATAPLAVTPAATPGKPSAPVMSQPKPVFAVEAPSAKEESEAEALERKEAAEEQPIVSVSAPVQTAIQASPKPFTEPPGLDELTFSEPPPARTSVAPGTAASEPPPVSSRHAISEAPESIDAALIAAAQAEAEAEEREGPLLTPPPESGKQPARPASGETAAYRQTAPTLEQLGEVVELEELSGPSLELAEPHVAAKKEEPSELEFVPESVARVPGGREAQPTLVGGFPEEEEPTSQRAIAELAKPATPVKLEPEVTVRRPIAAVSPINVVAQAQSFRPKSFLELLDASLKLGQS